jgi:O-antigen/teichoic acid export membrane protein
MAMFGKLKQIELLGESKLARNTGWMLLGLGLKFVVQGLFFAVIARALGVQNYGAFVGVVGLVGVVSPFAALGSANLLLKNVARDGAQFKKNYGLALLTTLLASALLFGLVISISHFLLPATIPLTLVMLVAAADLFGLNIVVICTQAFLAFERVKWTASINVLLSATRLAAALILVMLYRSPSALQWGFFYFGSTSIVMMVSLGLVLTKLGAPAFSLSRTAAEFREGIYFSVNGGAASIYNDIDKAMLARLGTLEATGIYGAAYRLIDVSIVPVSSLLAAAGPGFFRAGEEGISRAMQYAKPLVFRALAYGALISIALLAGAGILPYVLGGQYRLTVEALRWLSVIPMLKAVHISLSDALTAAGYQWLRTSIYTGVALFNVLINLWIIPAYSWRGAAWSSVASDVLLGCAIGAAVLVLCRRSQAGMTETEAFEVEVEA